MHFHSRTFKKCNSIPGRYEPRAISNSREVKKEREREVLGKFLARDRELEICRGKVAPWSKHHGRGATAGGSKYLQETWVGGQGFRLPSTSCDTAHLRRRTQNWVHLLGPWDLGVRALIVIMAWSGLEKKVKLTNPQSSVGPFFLFFEAFTETEGGKSSYTHVFRHRPSVDLDSCWHCTGLAL